VTDDLTDDLTDDQLDEALAIMSGRKPRPLTAEEAEYDLRGSRTFHRAPDARAVEARERVRAAQAAVKDVAPWRAAVEWGQYDELVEAEGNLAQLWASRRGITIERARAAATQALREAWTTGGANDDARLEAAMKELDRFATELARRPATAPRAEGLAAERRLQGRALPAEVLELIASRARDAAMRQASAANPRLTEASLARIASEVASRPLPLDGSGHLDEAAFAHMVVEVREAEETYLAQVGEAMGQSLSGARRRRGGTATEADVDTATGRLFGREAAAGEPTDLSDTELDEALGNLTRRTIIQEA